MADKLERIYTIPLGKAYDTVRLKRATRAVNLVRGFIAKHMKSNVVAVSNALNSFIWQRSREKPPRRVKVRALKQEEKVNVYLHDEKIEAPKLKEEKKTATDEKKEAKVETPKEEKPKEKKPSMKETQKAVDNKQERQITQKQAEIK